MTTEKLPKGSARINEICKSVYRKMTKRKISNLQVQSPYPPNKSIMTNTRNPLAPARTTKPKRKKRTNEPTKEKQTNEPTNNQSRRQSKTNAKPKKRSP